MDFILPKVETSASYLKINVIFFVWGVSYKSSIKYSVFIFVSINLTKRALDCLTHYFALHSYQMKVVVLYGNSVPAVVAMKSLPSNFRE